MDDRDVYLFEQTRPSLLGLAYRILGSRADAEDVVQDCFVKWQTADRASIVDPGAWLSTACTRRCLDVLRAAHRARVDYVGPWLPEPIQHFAPPAADSRLAASLTTAFLLILERLTPKERAAYLLREVFDQPYPQIAATLDIEEAGCRKLVSRERAHTSSGEKSGMSRRRTLKTDCCARARRNPQQRWTSDLDAVVRTRRRPRH